MEQKKTYNNKIQDCATETKEKKKAIDLWTENTEDILCEEESQLVQGGIIEHLLII